MKNMKNLLFVLISILFMNINVYAASGYLSVNNNSVYVGDSFVVSVNVNSTAAWNIHVNASGPVSGCVINEADATSNGLDTNKSFTATCNATGEGTVTLYLTGDITSAVDGIAVNLSDTKTVSVTTKPIDTRSSNVSLSSISVTNYDLTKVNNNNYTLTVPYDVTNVTVNATAADSKTKVNGIGSHDLNVGTNTIAIILIAENGAKNQVNLTVTRKDGYYLEDFDTAITKNEINIIVNNNETLTSEILSKVQKSGKRVSFSYYDENKVLIYSYTIDGVKLSNTNPIVLGVSNDTSNKASILKLSNYADGLFETINNIDSKGISLKIYVGNKYTNDDKLNVYSYDKEASKLNLLNTNLMAKDGYLEFNLDGNNDYFITMSTVNAENTIVTKSECNNNIILIIALIFIILILVCTIGYLFVINYMKNKQKSHNLNNENNFSTLNILNKEEANKSEPQVIISNYSTNNVQNTPSISNEINTDNNINNSF